MHEALPAHFALMLSVLGVFLLISIYAAVRAKFFRRNSSIKSKVEVIGNEISTIKVLYSG